MSEEENKENKVKIYPFIPKEMDADLIKRAEENGTSKGIEVIRDYQIAKSLRDLLELTFPKGGKK